MPTHISPTPTDLQSLSQAVTTLASSIADLKNSYDKHHITFSAGLASLQTLLPPKSNKLAAHTLAPPINPTPLHLQPFHGSNPLPIVPPPPIVSPPPTLFTVSPKPGPQELCRSELPLFPNSLLVHALLPTPTSFLQPHPQPPLTPSSIVQVHPTSPALSPPQPSPSPIFMNTQMQTYLSNSNTE